MFLFWYWLEWRMTKKTIPRLHSMNWKHSILSGTLFDGNKWRNVYQSVREKPSRIDIFLPISSISSVLLLDQRRCVFLIASRFTPLEFFWLITCRTSTKVEKRKQPPKWSPLQRRSFQQPWLSNQKRPVSLRQISSTLVKGELVQTNDHLLCVQF